jgi:hypothetical protein
MQRFSVSWQLPYVSLAMYGVHTNYVIGYRYLTETEHLTEVKFTAVCRRHNDKTMQHEGHAT